MKTKIARRPRAGTDYEVLSKRLFRAKRSVEEIAVPSVRIIATTGSHPPGGEEYSQAIAILYGLAYGLKMGLKMGGLSRPAGWFDFKVGPLETLWWSTRGALDIRNPATLRWKAYLMVPSYVGKRLFEAARTAASEKHPEIPYEIAVLETFAEGRSIQALHVGPWDREQPTIEALLMYATDHGLGVAGKHHEIYLSDPRRTSAAKLKTVIRLPVKAKGRSHALAARGKT